MLKGHKKTDLASPGPIGATTPSTGAFTTISAVRAAGGDVATFTNGAASNKTAYIYSDNTYVAFMDVAGAGAGNGVLVNAASGIVYTQVGGSSVITTTSAGATFAGTVKRSTTAGITADTGSAQGGSPLTSDINQISVCANAGDSVTMPTAVAGLDIVVINNGANSADVFPASGDNLGAGVDTAVALASGATIRYVAYDATNWAAV